MYTLLGAVHATFSKIKSISHHFDDIQNLTLCINSFVQHNKPFPVATTHFLSLKKKSLD